VEGSLFPFPGYCSQPPTATSAALALADAWLGDEPFFNPSTPIRNRVVLSPVLLRVSRQDLRAANRNYDEQTAFFDGASAALVPPAVPIWLYFSQPALRLEQYVFNRGTGQDPSVPPATLTGEGETRETRVGVASALGWGLVRAGAAFEWTHRRDRYRTVEESGSPDQGEREASFSGGGLGGALGVRLDQAPARWTVGLGVRYLPALDLAGEARSDLLSGSSTTPIAAAREAGWEAGVSARYGVTTGFDVYGAASHRTEQEWDGFGVVSGARSTWTLALAYGHPEDPWEVRFGLGQEQQTQVPEPRAGVVGLGLAWDLEGVVVDVGAMRRSLARSGAPTSFDDRVVGSVRVDF
jgi:hypothetical protein